jgi:hypothetical protein
VNFQLAQISGNGIYSAQSCQARNSNIEIRNNFKPSKDQNPKLKSEKKFVWSIGMFCHLTLFRASDFVLRICRFYYGRRATLTSFLYTSGNGWVKPNLKLIDENLEMGRER